MIFADWIGELVRRMVLICARSNVGDTVRVAGGLSGSANGELLVGFGEVTRLSKSCSGDLNVREGMSDRCRRGLDSTEEVGLGEAVRSGCSETLLAILKSF